MTGSQPPATARRPDAITALLGEIWDQALDPGYAQAALARAGDNNPDDTSSRRITTGLALALVGLVLAVAAVSTAASRPAVAQRRASLVQRVEGQTAAYDRAVNDLTTLQAQVDALKAQQLAGVENGQAVSDRLAALAAAAAQTAVSGPALVVTLDDAASAATLGNADSVAGGDPTLGRVLDRDLQLAVNGLWDSGAEAVAVNGVRLSALSSIRSAGDAILVDYRPLARPYVITAIGDPKTIDARFAAGPAGRGLRTLSEAYGLRFSLSNENSVTMKAATAVTLRYARPTSEGAK